MDISTGMTITPRMGGGHNYETYWVVGGKLSLLTRAKYIQAQRPNDFCKASIISNNYTKGLLD